VAERSGDGAQLRPEPNFIPDYVIEAYLLGTSLEA